MMTPATDLLYRQSIEVRASAKQTCEESRHARERARESVRTADHLRAEISERRKVSKLNVVTT
jgi:hypothetical protein